MHQKAASNPTPKLTVPAPKDGPRPISGVRTTNSLATSKTPLALHLSTPEDYPFTQQKSPQLHPDLRAPLNVASHGPKETLLDHFT